MDFLIISILFFIFFYLFISFDQQLYARLLVYHPKISILLFLALIVFSFTVIIVGVCGLVIAFSWLKLFLTVMVYVSTAGIARNLGIMLGDLVFIDNCRLFGDCDIPFRRPSDPSIILLLKEELDKNDDIVIPPMPPKPPINK